jgi:hypothetical protein
MLYYEDIILDVLNSWSGTSESLHKEVRLRGVSVEEQELYMKTDNDKGFSNLFLEPLLKLKDIQLKMKDL